MDHPKSSRPIPHWYFVWRWLALCAIGLFGAVIIASVLIVSLISRGLPPETDRYVIYVSFSSDGKYVLTGSLHGLARLWDSETGIVLRTFGDSTNPVGSVVFSPNGKYLLTGNISYGAPLKLWDTTTGALLRTIQGDPYIVCSMAFSPDSKYILTVSESGAARLWDAATGAMLHKLGDHKGCSAAFSPDNKSVLISNSDGSATLWDVATGTALRTFVIGSDGFRDTAISSNGIHVALIRGSTATLLNVVTGATLCTFGGSTEYIDHITFSPDGKYVLAGSLDGTIKLWDVATCQFLRSVGDSDSPSAHSIAISPDGKYVLRGGDEGTAKLWDLATGKLLRTFAYKVDVPPALVIYTLLTGIVQSGYWAGLGLTMLSLISGILINTWFHQKHDELRIVSWRQILRLPLLASAIAAVLFSLAMILLYIFTNLDGAL